MSLCSVLAERAACGVALAGGGEVHTDQQWGCNGGTVLSEQKPSPCYSWPEGQCHFSRCRWQGSVTGDVSNAPSAPCALARGVAVAKAEWLRFLGEEADRISIC